jgi:hypothetical protein
VAFVQGLDSDAARAEQAKGLLALVATVPPKVPSLGRVTLRPKPPIDADFAGQGALDARGHFVDPAHGLDVGVAGLRLQPTSNVELLAMGDDHLVVTLSPLWAPPSDALADGFLAAFAKGYQQKIPRGPIVDLGTSRVELSSISLDARTLRIGPLEARLVLVPACGGRMSIAMVTIAQPETSSVAAADRWLEGVQVRDASPACDALKSLRDPSAAVP